MSASARVPRTAPRWSFLVLVSAGLAVAALAVEAPYLHTMSEHGTGVFGWELVILGYVGLIFGLAEALACQASDRARSWAESAAWLAVAGGAANVIAKVIQLLILNSDTHQPIPAFGFAAAILNYVLILAAIATCVIGWAINRRHTHPRRARGEGWHQ